MLTRPLENNSAKSGVKRAESRANMRGNTPFLAMHVGKLALQQDPAVERTETADRGEHGQDLARRAAPKLRGQIGEWRVR